VQKCCKGDDASQWRNPKFAPPVTLEPHRGQSWKLAEVMDPYTYAKVCHDPPRGFISAHAWLCAPKVFTRLVFSRFGGFLQLVTARAAGQILTQNTPKHAVPHKDVPSRGREHKIWYLNPYFPELAPFFGPFLTGLGKFSPKIRLTMGMLPLEHLLIVIVDA